VINTKEEMIGSLSKNLSPERYLTEVRRFIPAYDEMASEISSSIIKYKPSSVLDVGCGVGNIDKIVLEALPECRVTCIDPTEKMAEACRKNLSEYDGRVKVLGRRIREFNCGRIYDLAFSSLALHNIDKNEKLEVFSRIKNSLKPGGHFIIGDFIRYNQLKQFSLVATRHFTASLKGANPLFAFDHYQREMFRDYKQSKNETLNTCHIVGFKDEKVIWENQFSTVAIFYMKA
jgi:SAM-dependent methyltransferase